MVEKDDEVELMEYAKELKLLERIGDRIEVNNHWLVEILGVLKEIRNREFEVSIPKEAETEKIDETVDPPIKEIMKEVLEGNKEDKTLTKIQVESVFPLDNSYMLKDGKGHVAFIGKKLVKSATGDTVFLTEAAKKWFTKDKIKWKLDGR